MKVLKQRTAVNYTGALGDVNETRVRKEEEKKKKKDEGIPKTDG